MPTAFQVPRRPNPEATEQMLERLSRAVVAGYGDMPGMTKHPEAERILSADPVDGILIESFRVLWEWLEKAQSAHPALQQGLPFLPADRATLIVDRLAKEWHQKWEEKLRLCEEELRAKLRRLMEELREKKAA